MRWFSISAVGAMALALANPTPAKAQLFAGGYPTFFAPNSIPFVMPGVPFLGGSSLIRFANGGPVEFGLNRALWSMASHGYGPFASYFSPFGAPRYFSGAVPTYYGPWGPYRPYNMPANNGKWVEPWHGNPGLHKGWYKGGGKGKGGKGR